MNRNPLRLNVVIASLTTFSVVVGACDGPTTAVAGHAMSMRYDPFRVAGLPTSDGPSGPRTPLPDASSRVQNTDDSEVDRLALLAIQDIESYWSQHYSDMAAGSFVPVSTLVSVDTADPDSSGACGGDPTQFRFNAVYCRTRDTMAWDRSSLLPSAQAYFGDLAINGVLAHEYGHAVQWQASLVDEDTPTLVSEQQADCLAGAYLRSVAQGGSPRFSLNTTGALDRVIAGAIALRDPPAAGGLFSVATDAHGTALDRVGALQQGFDVGTEACAAIDMAEIESRRGLLPDELFDPASDQSDLDITGDALVTLFAVLNRIFPLTAPPKLSTSGTACERPNVQPTAYCPGSHTVSVDLGALQRVGTPADENQLVLLQGDNTAISMVTSRYMLAVQQERGAALNSPVAAMRTACLTGVAQKEMAQPVATDLVLGAGDLDEAISGLLTNGIVASDVDGSIVPSGFTRISAFRAGLLGDVNGCFRRFP